MRCCGCSIKCASRRFLSRADFRGLYEPAYDGYYREMPEVLGKFEPSGIQCVGLSRHQMARTTACRTSGIVPNGASELEFGVRGTRPSGSVWGSTRRRSSFSWWAHSRAA